MTGTLELDHVDFDVRDGLREAVDAFRVVAASKGLELVCDIGSGVPPMVVGDPARLRQGLVNLLGNAKQGYHPARTGGPRGVRGRRNVEGTRSPMCGPVDGA